jgi:multisubunit Na+/H+ antiporter MnhG subunit
MDSESWHRPWPLGVLLFGLFFLLLAAIGLFTGKMYERFGSTTDRSKDPVQFWLSFAVSCLCGAFLIWYWAFVLQH